MRMPAVDGPELAGRENGQSIRIDTIGDHLSGDEGLLGQPRSYLVSVFG